MLRIHSSKHSQKLSNDSGRYTNYADIEVVGEAENGEEVVHSMPYICPSAIVMDINMPKLNGIEATRTMKANYPDVVIVGLSAHADKVYQVAMIAAGVKSVVPKEMAGLFLYRQIKNGIEIYRR